VSLGSFVANELSDLEFAESVDDRRTYNQDSKEGRKTGKGGTKRQEAENAEGRKVLKQLSV
jgi:hypothetical protein